MISPFLAILHIFMSFPQPIVNWVGQDAVNISVSGSEELLERCLASGIEVRYRYEFQICQKRSGWIDSCQDLKREIRSMQFDPVSENYTVTVDRHGDNLAPESSTQHSKNDAQLKVSKIENLPLKFLDQNFSLASRDGYYISMRVVADCKGSMNSALLAISNILTFGQVKIDRFDSGWIAFDIDR